MQYNPPINGDTQDADRPYINGDRQNGTEGSIPSAPAIEHPQREILAVIEAAGLVPDENDLTQLLTAIQNLVPDTTDSFGGSLLHIQDQKPSGTNGGSSVAGIQTRILNTVLTNEIAGASLASNQITLPAGTYIVQARCPAYNPDDHKAFLHNVTDAADVVTGSTEYNSYTLLVTNASVFGKFTIADTKVFELRHYIGLAVAGNGLGAVFSTSGATEVYSDIQIWKVG